MKRNVSFFAYFWVYKKSTRMSSAVKSSELFFNRSDLQKLKRQSNNVPEVLVVVQRIADNEFIGNLEADVVWHITVAEVGSLPE